MRAGFLAFALLLMLPAEGLAEWQLKPFVGVDFGATTTFADLDHVAGKPHVSFGVNGLVLGQVFGVEGEVSFAPGFFNAKEQQLVVDSSVTTATANLVVAFPRRWSQYTLRPYVVGGGGVASRLSSTHLPRFTGEVRVGFEVSVRMLPWVSTPWRGVPASETFTMARASAKR